MATGALPRGFAPHHLGPPPRRQPQYQAQGQHGGGVYVPAPAAAAPSLMKRPATAQGAVPVPSVVQRQAQPSAQRQAPGYSSQYTMRQEPLYGQQKQPYGSRAAYAPTLVDSSEKNWPDALDTSSESLTPAGYQPASVDVIGGSLPPKSPGQVDMNDFPNYQRQVRAESDNIMPRNIAPQLLHADTPRSPTGRKASMEEMMQVPRINAAYAQRSAAPPPSPAPEMDQLQGYVQPGRSEIDDDTSLIRSEADKIAQRLLKTEQELERLKKQGDLIGESIMRKLHGVD